METLAASLRQRLASFPENGCFGDFGNRAHLEWMISNAEAEIRWPRDKRVRWMGFVAGSTDFAIHGPQASVARMVGFDCAVLSKTDPQFERILFSGLDEVLEWLESVCEEKGSVVGAELASAARRSPTAAKASFCLGYFQAYMTAWNMLDVNAERDRTRPIFHRVYAQCGYDIPASRDRETVHADNKE